MRSCAPCWRRTSVATTGTTVPDAQMTIPVSAALAAKGLPFRPALRRLRLRLPQNMLAAAREHGIILERRPSSHQAASRAGNGLPAPGKYPIKAGCQPYVSRPRTGPPRPRRTRPRESLETTALPLLRESGRSVVSGSRMAEDEHSHRASATGRRAVPS
jgi:hypothetical protein